MDNAIKDALGKVIDLYAVNTLRKPTFGFILSDGRFLDLGNYYDNHTDMYIDLLIRRNIGHPEGRRMVSSDEEVEQAYKLDDELAPLLGIRYNSGTESDPKRYFVVNKTITDAQRSSLEKWLITLGHKSVEEYCGEHYYLFDLSRTSPDDIVDTVKRGLAFGKDARMNESISSNLLPEFMDWLDNNVGTTDTPIMNGPTYILPNGRFVRILGSKAGNVGQTHEQFNDWLDSQGWFGRFGIDHFDYGYLFDEFTSIRLDAKDLFLDLPPKEQMPNSAMMDSLLKWMQEYFVHPPKDSSHPGDERFFQICTDDGTMWWDLKKTTPEEALKAIRRYYSEGQLVLDSYEGIEELDESVSVTDGMSIFAHLMNDDSFSGSDGYYAFSFSDTPTERCFILPSGRCVLLPESLGYATGEHFKPHYILDDWIYYTIVKGDMKDNHFPDWMDEQSFSKMKAWLESVTPVAGEKTSGCPAIKAIGGIRVNGYRERFIDLPDEPITGQQESILSGWLDRFFTKGRPNLEVDMNGSYATYHYSSSTGTDYVMHRIERAYRYGRLDESVSSPSPSDVEDYLMKLNRQTGAGELTGAEYVMPDGRLLDVSSLNSDTKEHEGVWEQIHSKWKDIDGEDWCLKNLIRLSYTGLWIPRNLTDEQRRVLVRICDEFDSSSSIMARDMLNPFTDDGRNDARILSVYLPPDWTHGQKADMGIVSGGELYKRIMKAVSDGTGILSESIGKDKEDDENPELSTIEAIRRMRL